MNPHYSPATKRFLIAVGLCMQKIETKAKRVKFTPTLSPSDFTASQQKFIEGLVNRLWKTQIDSTTRDRVLSALNGNDKAIIDAAQANIQKWSDDIWAPGIAKSANVAGESMSLAIGDAINSRLFFDLTHDSIQKWLTEDAGELIKTFNKQVILNVKATVKAALANNWTFLESKALMGDSLTLIPSWNDALIKFYNQQYNSLFKEFSKEFTPARAAKKARAVAQWRKARRLRKRLDTRQEMIARTELKRAFGASQESSFIQARELGFIKDVRRTWRRTSGVDNHPSSIANDGVTKPLGQPFTGGGTSQMFETEINGQCIIEYDFRRVEK